LLTSPSLPLFLSLAVNNPNAMKELLKLQEDPELMREVEELMDDPEFQHEMAE
jgi:hypothetical protein